MSKYKFPILAKPSGITLEQHKLDVMLEGVLLSKQMPFVFEKYEQRVGKNLSRRLKIGCEYHDDGKINDKWQSACQMDYEEFVEWQSKNKGDFKDYSKNNDAGKHIRKSGIRHEFQSLMLNLKCKMPLPLQSAIAAHHGKLGILYEDRWQNEGCWHIWQQLRIESQRLIDSGNLEKIANLQYEYAGPRGLLQLSDHRASAKEDGASVPDYKPFNYKFPFESKRGVQTLVENYWSEDLLLVRAPTGAGKTDASLLWASLQIANKRADRLIIAMPTRFTSNALAVNVAENLSETGLYHSSAWFSKFQQKVDDGTIKIQEARKCHEFARLLETPVTVCTIDHLLMALTLTREDHHLISFNLANSCLVIDEADFYDDFTQSNILVLLEILKYWKVPVLLMSASLPESVLLDYKNIGYNVKTIIEDKSDVARERFQVEDIRNYDDVSELEDLFYLMIKQGNGIIYANTIDSAMSFYNWFEQYNETAEQKIDIILYHSRFTEPDKLNKEASLINILGKNAWENKLARGIAIMTQIGEMSINISADIMISEICPIDRLIQRAGRMCRFDKNKIGSLYILNPYKKEAFYPAPYGHYDMRRKSWEPCDALIETINRIEKKKYNADKLVLLLNTIYAKGHQHSVKSIDNAKCLKEYFMWNWLITSKQNSQKDDTDVGFWKSRDIFSQDTVFVSQPDALYFSNQLDFQSWKIYNSIEMPVYLIEKGRKQHKIDLIKVLIKENEETIYVIRNGFYNNQIGVSFIVDDEIFL